MQVVHGTRLPFRIKGIVVVDQEKPASGAHHHGIRISAQRPEDAVRVPNPGIKDECFRQSSWQHTAQIPWLKVRRARAKGDRGKGRTGLQIRMARRAAELHRNLHKIRFRQW